MKRLRILINGFGRIGRCVFRQALASDACEVVAINDLNPDVAGLVYQLKYDSTWGRLAADVVSTEQGFSVDGKDVAVSSNPDLAQVLAGLEDIDLVLDATGAKYDLATVNAALGRARHHLYTHWVSADMPTRTVMFGVNDQDFDPRQDRRISTSICDAISLGPILKLLGDEFGLGRGFLTTLHPWLAYQRLLDSNAPGWSHPTDNSSNHSLGRAAVNNLIPKSTTAMFATDIVLPGSLDKIDSFSYRVPTNVVTSATLNIKLNTAASAQDVTNAFSAAQARQSHRVFHMFNEPLVSTDFAGDEHSVCIDQRWTVVNQDGMLRLVYFYDNEWGYSARVVDTIRMIASAQ